VTVGVSFDGGKDFHSIAYLLADHTEVMRQTSEIDFGPGGTAG
jgi:hypothetical protein